MNRLGGSTIIITGVAGGIGSAAVLKCIEEGAVVLGCDNDSKNLKNLKESIRSDKLHIFRVDVSNYREVDLFFQAIKKDFPETNCLVNNAGIYFGKSILDYSTEMIDRVIDINIKGAVFFSKLFGAYFKSGSIVNISSVSGQEGSSDAIYGMSKAAVFGLTKSCAMNFAPDIRVNAVAPGIVNTRMLGNIPDWRIEEYRSSELLSDEIKPSDVADSIVFLLSNESLRYTGAVFDLNNGCYLR